MPVNDTNVVVYKAAEVFFKNAIKQAVDNTFYNLQCLLGITDGGFNPSCALLLNEHLDALVKDYCEILKDQRMCIK